MKTKKAKVVNGYVISLQSLAAIQIQMYEKGIIESRELVATVEKLKNKDPLAYISCLFQLFDKTIIGSQKLKREVAALKVSE